MAIRAIITGTVAFPVLALIQRWTGPLQMQHIFDSAKNNNSEYY